MKYPMESDSLEIKNNNDIGENVKEENNRKNSRENIRNNNRENNWNNSRENNKNNSRRINKNEANDSIQLLIVLFPFAIGILSFIYKSIPMALAIIVIDLIIVALLPLCHGRENLWYFLILAFTSIPAYIWISIKTAYFLAIEIYESKIIYIPFIILIFFGIFSIEEVVMSVVVRAIWRRQKKSLLNTYFSHS